MGVTSVWPCSSANTDISPLRFESKELESCVRLGDFADRTARLSCDPEP